IVVKGFGPDRKEIASNKFIGKLVDVVALESSDLHGIYEINGEAVVFISQAITNRNTLVALRFNAQTGNLIEEHQVATSPSFQRKNTYSLVRNTVNGGYAVFCMKDLVANPRETLNLLVFDDEHKVVRDIPVTVDVKEYDYTKHVSTSIGNDGGIAVFLDCIKIIHYPDDNDHFITTCYLAPGDTAFSNVMTKLPKQIGPLYGTYTYNEFSKTLNVLLVNATTVVRTAGFRALSEIIYSPFMLMYSKSNLADMKFSPVKHEIANKQLRDATDTTKYTEPVPLRIYTNKYGVNTIISEENKQNVRFPNGNTAGSYIGNIVVTKVGEDGREIWSETLPKSQYLLYVMPADHLHRRGSHKFLFRREQPESDWLYQFSSFYSLETPNGDCYVIYNDLQSNFNHTLSDTPDPVSSYTGNNNITNASAICYKVTARRQSTKQYLLDGIQTEISPGSVMIEGCDYNEKANTFAGLFYLLENDVPTLRLGWVKLDE
ncbi:MAG TPA: hypothetical protein VIN07_11105, partial [Flavipsychrobacter sp.]